MTTIASTDRAVRTAVQEELDWSPDVDSTRIGVAVDEGVVTVSGQVDTYAERMAALRAVHRVRGVRAVVDDVAVQPSGRSAASELDVAREVEHALDWASDVPAEVRAEIRGHDVTLTGEVDWEFQRLAAKRAIEHLRGIRNVTNRITLRARPSAADTQEHIRRALTRNAQLDAEGIDVSVSDCTVTLTGTVQSWAEKQQANHAAWASPHVAEVIDRIVVHDQGEEGTS
ncbi:BON domain-containing protein [Agromyces sp. SYSU T00194]|uniref:BON domain-containing protein n=1 Tax=Agromyces chitinivorans TaxID=3158560 RepID=UPI00339B9D79